uniref:Uncharacterized protein n=1 Tax=Opuntia streptacantha TaxID=393608 RepID=A0A7C9ARS4_OPUST
MEVTVVNRNMSNEFIAKNNEGSIVHFLQCTRVMWFSKLKQAKKQFSISNQTRKHPKEEEKGKVLVRLFHKLEYQKKLNKQIIMPFSLCQKGKKNISGSLFTI